MTTSNLQSRRRHRTCAHCGGPRDGHAWRSDKPVCASCGARHGPRAEPSRCPRRCGPDGVVGPACRYNLPAPGVPHQQPCAPTAGASRVLQHILQLQAQRQAEAIHG
ncbi:MAG: hypothetical protein WC876_04485 [Candidatus Thermoplasmatota archaeon]|jgi:ribosomal protein L40E